MSIRKGITAAALAWGVAFMAQLAAQAPQTPPAGAPAPAPQGGAQPPAGRGGGQRGGGRATFPCSDFSDNTLSAFNALTVLLSFSK